MILIVILLLLSFYLSWHFEQQRKRRIAKLHKEKLDAFNKLLESLQPDENKTNE